MSTHDLARAPWDGPDGVTGLHEARAELMERAVRFERALDDVLALMLGRDSACADLLRDVLARQSAKQRLDLLEDLFDLRELHDDFPFVLPVSRRLTEVRNALAHSEVVGYTPNEAGGVHAISLASYYRGRERTQDLRLGLVVYLCNAATAVANDLRTLWARISDEDTEDGDLACEEFVGS